MQNGERIREFVNELDRYSGGVLSLKTDLALLLGLAWQNDEGSKLDRLAFLSKFVAKSRKIMDRIGRDAEGYDKISAELAVCLEETCALLTHLAAFAPDAERSRFSQTYLARTPDALQRLFLLLSDLSWYKNWKIDHREWKL